MVERCEPPNGTPAGTVCVLSNGNLKTKARWDGAWWRSIFQPPHGASPARVAECGWRFVRIAGEGEGG